MSYKTEGLTSVISDAYAVDDAESLLYKLLDAFGAELMTADEKLKRLLKSHWVNYADGPALEGLAAVFGVRRRLLRDGVTPESDEAFRTRLKAVVPTFAGGGTRQAVLGAVRSAFGLPYDLRDLNLPDGLDALRDDIERLIILEEFSPKAETLVGDDVAEIDDASQLTLVVDIPTVREVRPRIRWTCRDNEGRQRMSVELVGTTEGIKTTRDGLVVPANETLVLSADAEGLLNARLAGEDVSRFFVNLDDSAPAIMPEVPRTRSEWRFRAQSGAFDTSKFDSGEIYDLPEYAVEMSWWRYEPLTFDVRVPYFLDGSVRQLAQQHGYTGAVFEFQELPPERIQEVVDQTRAAGVRGHVHFSLNWAEDHDQHEESTGIEGLQIEGLHRASEDAAAADSLSVGSFNREAEVQDIGEVFVIGGVWDVSTFDGGYGFQ
ncbi:MAG TPA: hypothetical protein VFI90_02545 [Rubrobacter sp.]|nr:hypothetical protein [Rubrobacter sp.]